jgi:hypothetical protein
VVRKQLLRPSARHHRERATSGGGGGTIFAVISTARKSKFRFSAAWAEFGSCWILDERKRLEKIPHAR